MIKGEQEERKRVEHICKVVVVGGGGSQGPGVHFITRVFWLFSSSGIFKNIYILYGLCDHVCMVPD